VEGHSFRIKGGKGKEKRGRTDVFKIRQGGHTNLRKGRGIALQSIHGTFVTGNQVGEEPFRETMAYSGIGKPKAALVEGEKKGKKPSDPLSVGRQKKKNLSRGEKGTGSIHAARRVLSQGKSKGCGRGKERTK